MTLPWDEWANDLGYPDRKTLLKELWIKHKNINIIADKIGVVYSTIDYWMKRDGIDYHKRSPGGPNNIGPNYPVIRWALNIPANIIKNKTIRDIIDMSWEKPTKRLIVGMQTRLMYHGIEFKAGVRGRPIKYKKEGK